jgi:hypothetical protein
MILTTTMNDVAKMWKDVMTNSALFPALVGLIGVVVGSVLTLLTKVVEHCLIYRKIKNHFRELEWQRIPCPGERRLDC